MNFEGSSSSSVELVFVAEEGLTAEQRSWIQKLNAEAFGNISTQEAEEDFIAEPFGRLFAIFGDECVGMAQLFRRPASFSGKSYWLGGIGGVCVTAAFQRRGIGLNLVREAMRMLYEQGCDIACLNVDLEKSAYKLYEQAGFVLLQRDVSFENVRGELVFEPGTMLAPLRSPELCAEILKSQETFHYGRGYW